MTSVTSSMQAISSVSHLYTDQVLHQLKAAFPVKVITPETKMEQVMYEAGRQSVILHVEQQIRTNRNIGK